MELWKGHLLASTMVVQMAVQKVLHLADMMAHQKEIWMAPWWE